MRAFICPLASGSLGNALLVATDRTQVLVDLGISRRRLKAGLAAVGADPEGIRAVLLTHTHRDHFSASAVAWCLGRRIPVYSTEDNLAHLAYDLDGFAELVAGGLARPIDGQALHIGDVTVESFPVPHDSAGQCLGFRLTLGGSHRRRAVAVATDLGHVPAESLRWFLESDAVVIESNYDAEMLKRSGRPRFIVDRIAGPLGHLANEQAAEMVAEILGRSSLERQVAVVLFHLSEDANTPAMALRAHERLLGANSHRLKVSVAETRGPSPLVVL